MASCRINNVSLGPSMDGNRALPGAAQVELELVLQSG